MEKASGRGLQRRYVPLRSLQDIDFCGPPEERQRDETETSDDSIRNATL